MTTDKIINKIQKLLALASNNSSQAEAQSALLMAQKLMAEYGVEVSMTQDEVIEYEMTIATTKGNKGFRINLANIIARNFRCRVLVHNNNIAFFGHKNDARICKDAFEYAYNFAKRNGDKEYARARDEAWTSKNVFNSYVMGFMKGLTTALDAQCQALMIITPRDVNEAYDEKTKNFGRYKGGMTNNKSIGFNTQAYQKGHSDGKSLYEKKQLNG